MLATDSLAPVDHTPVDHTATIRAVFPAILSASAIAALDGNIVTAALPIIASDLHGIDELFWVVTAFMLAQSATLLLNGKLSDIYGRRPLYLFAISIFVFGSACCGFAPNMLVLILSRGVQGVGAAGLFSLASATMADLVPPRERGRYQGMITGTFALASLVGPVVGGLITSFLGWRWVFLINLPLGLVVGVLLMRGLPHSTMRRGQPIDWIGMVLIVSAPTAGLLAMTYAGTKGLGSPLVLTLGAAAAVLVVALIRQKRRFAYPMLDLGLFRDPVFARCAVTISLVAFSFFGAIVFLPLYLQMARGVDPASSGGIMVPQLLGLFCASVLGGRAITALGRFKPFIVVGVLTIGLSLTAMGSLILIGAPIPLLLVVLFFLGVGGGLAMPTITLAAQSTVSREHNGSATSLMAFSHAVSAASGAAISGTIVSARVTSYLGARLDAASAARLARIGVRELAALAEPLHSIVELAYAHAIAMAFLTGGGVIMLGAVAACTIPNRKLHDAAAD